MTEQHEAIVEHENRGDHCHFRATCWCGAEVGGIDTYHTDPDHDVTCGRVRRSLYQWGREHADG